MAEEQPNVTIIDNTTRQRASSGPSKVSTSGRDTGLDDAAYDDIEEDDNNLVEQLIAEETRNNKHANKKKG